MLLTLYSTTDEHNIFDKPSVYVFRAYQCRWCYSQTDCNGECIYDCYMSPFHCAM